MKRIMLLLAFIIFSQYAKAEDNGTLMWSHYNPADFIDLEFSPTDPNIVAALEFFPPDHLNNAYLFDVQSGDTLRIIKFDKEEILTTLTFSNDGSKLVFGTDDNDIILYVITEDKLEYKLNFGDFGYSQNSVRDMEYTHDGKYLIVSCKYLFVINSEDWTIKQQWNEIERSLPIPPWTELDDPTDISVSYDNKYVSIVFGGTRIVVIYDIEKNENIKSWACQRKHAQFYHNSNKIMIHQENQFLEYDVTTEDKRELKPVGGNMQISENDELIYIILPQKTEVYRITDNTLIGTINVGNGYGYDYLADVLNDQYFFTGNLEMYDISGVTSVEIDETEQIDIYPNPAEEYIEISIDVYNRRVMSNEIEIYDMLGNVVFNSTPSLLRNATPQEGNFKIDVSQLPKGVYFVKIGDRMEKFVKL